MSTLIRGGTVVNPEWLVNKNGHLSVLILSVLFLLSLLVGNAQAQENDLAKLEPPLQQMASWAGLGDKQIDGCVVIFQKNPESGEALLFAYRSDGTVRILKKPKTSLLKAFADYLGKFRNAEGLLPHSVTVGLNKRGEYGASMIYDEDTFLGAESLYEIPDSQLMKSAEELRPPI